MKNFIFGLAIALVLASASSASAYTYTRDLTLGATGADVVALQDTLIAGGYLVMPAGVSKGYFGALTQSAVAKWQAAVGIAPAAGYVGPISRAKLSMAVTTPTTPATPSTTLKGGDGDFKSFGDISSVDNETVEAGDSEMVLGFEFEADDSDLMIERVNVLFSTTTNEKPWKFFDEVALYNGDDKVADVDASDEDNWDETTDDVYEISFTGLTEIVEEGDEAEFYVEVTANDDDDDLPVTWTVELEDDAVRAVNAEGINVYSGNTGFTTTFEQEAATASDLSNKFKASENEDMDIEVDDSTDTTDEVLVYKFSVEPQDGDINIDEVVVMIGTTTGTSATVEEMVKTVYLFIDGDEVAKESGDTTVTFDDLDYDLGEDEEVDVEIYVDVEGTDDGDQYASGSGIQVTNVAIDYEDSEDDDQTETVSNDGGEISFYTAGITATYKSSSATVTYGSYSGDNDRGIFTIVFEVTAFGEDDVYVGGANSVTQANEGVQYSISSSTAGTITKAELTSTADEGDNDTFVVSSGDTETFTFTVEVSDASTTAADVAQRLTITRIDWDTDDDSTPDSSYSANLDDFKTASKTI